MADTSIPAVHDIAFHDAEGLEQTLGSFNARLLLIVNVASKCGMTPQYEQLEQLQRTYGDRGLQVIGFPCNQFMGQEPGSMAEILEFCSTTYGISFPIMEKLRVNGSHAAPLYKALKKSKNPEGVRGPIAWNFEKFLVTPAGEVHRFRPQTRPDAPEIVAVIEAALGASGEPA